jgi:hypothetical protein
MGVGRTERRKRKRRSRKENKGEGGREGGGTNKEDGDTQAEIKKLKLEIKNRKKAMEELERREKERTKGGEGRDEDSDSVEDEGEEEETIEYEKGKDAKKGGRRGIVLPKLKGEEVTEEAMRRFVLKAREKMKREGNVKEVLREVSSALVGRAYDIYHAFSGNKQGIQTEKDMEMLFKHLMDNVSEKKNVKARSLQLQERGQGEKETIRMWGSMVKSQLSAADAPDCLMEDTFVNGLLCPIVRDKMKKRLNMEDMTLDQAIEVAEKIHAGRLGVKKEEKKMKKEEEKTVAPIFTINIDAEMCKQIVNTANQHKGEKRVTFDMTKLREEGRRMDVRKERGNECYRCGREGHRAFECDREPACYNCKRPGHRAAECNTEYCEECKRFGHTKQKCWELYPQLRRGGESRGRGRGSYRGRGNTRGWNRGRGGGRGYSDRGSGEGGAEKKEGNQGGGIELPVTGLSNKDAKEYHGVVEDVRKYKKITDREQRGEGRGIRNKNTRKGKKLRKEYRIRRRRRFREERENREKRIQGIEVVETNTPEEMEKIMREKDEEDTTKK